MYKIKVAIEQDIFLLSNFAKCVMYHKTIMHLCTYM